MSDEKRRYRKRLRAESEAQTRLLITESAVQLHGTLGPARTSISAIAEHAGVRRSTVYRHFPDEGSLFRACSSLWMSRNPPPDPAAWGAIDDPGARVRAVLTDLYAYYRRTEPMLANLHRDEATVPAIRERFQGFREYLAGIALLIAPRGQLRGRAHAHVAAAIAHALSFGTWRSLVLEQGLAQEEAVELMVALICKAAKQPRARVRLSSGRSGR